MKKFLYIAFIFMACSCHYVQAQVHASRQVLFSSPDSAKNTVYNLGEPVQGNSAVHARNAATNNLVFDNTATGVDTIALNLALTPDSLKPGMLIGFRAPATINRAVMLAYNSQYYHLLSDEAAALKHAQIAAGQMVYCLFDGTSFQLVNTVLPFCPTGFTQVNNRYCIETDEHPLNYFWDAVNYCAGIDAKICTWGEWYYACTQTGLGLLNMTTNYEWVDDAGDHTQFAIAVGSGGTCTLNTSISVAGFSPANKKNFRCCYRK